MDIEKHGFQKLSAKDKPLFDKYYDDMNNYWPSSICFASMIAWNHSIKVFYRLLKFHLVCIVDDYESNRWVVLPFLGKYENTIIENTMVELQEILQVIELPFIMTDVSEWMKPYYLSIPGIKLEVSNERGLSDYIYTAKDFEASMDTQDNRYNYKYFIRKYQPTIEMLTPEHFLECIDFINEVWCSSHSCTECTYGCLKDTAREVIMNIVEIEAQGIIARVDGNIVGYCIIFVHNRQAFYLFKKTKRNYRGVNEFLHKQCYDLLCKDVTIINYTEDMNIEGLRKYKCRLAKYKLEPKYELQQH